MNFSFHSSLFSLLLVFLKLTQCADQSIMSYQTINPDPKELASLPDETRLIYNLMRNYDPASRPVYNASKPVQIKFGMSFIQLCDMDEKNQVLTSNVWLEFVPDMVLYNSADDFNQGFMQAKTVIEPNGRVFWSPPVKLRSICRIDVTFFPFDDQICHLKFGSWTYTGWSLDLVNRSAEAELSNYMASGEWDLKEITVKRNVRFYSCCPDEPFPDVMFYIHIRRRILYYLVNIMIPCIFLSMISVMTFWLPPDSGEKIALSITVLLAYSVFMLLIAENIPATSEMVPLIGIYLTFTMSLTFFSIVLTVFVLQLHHATHYAPRISRRVYDFITIRMGTLLGMKSTVTRFEKAQLRMTFKSRLKTFIRDEEKILNFDSGSTGGLSGLGACPSPRARPKPVTTNVVGGVNSPRSPRTLRIHEQHQPQQHTSKIPMSSAAARFDIKSMNSSESIAQTTNLIYLNRQSQKQQQQPIQRPPKSLFGSKMSMPIMDETASIRRSAYANFQIVEQEETRVESIRNEWKLVALIVDRFLFWVFSSLTIISSIFLLIVIPVLKNLNIIAPYHQFT